MKVGNDGFLEGVIFGIFAHSLWIVFILLEKFVIFPQSFLYFITYLFVGLIVVMLMAVRIEQKRKGFWSKYDKNTRRRNKIVDCKRDK